MKANHIAFRILNKSDETMFTDRCFFFDQNTAMRNGTCRINSTVSRASACCLPLVKTQRLAHIWPISIGRLAKADAVVIRDAAKKGHR
ncbi:hypothetical protein [Acidithiobacillus ferridurans]|uniref:hypothetical protein n=1 Tax=Acidithiobacillus ferridurans TaxID=1232575 RepID=UPI0015EFA6F0|nr:hypothetical protein [Acidithiobacillus ferridurans]